MGVRNVGAKRLPRHLRNEDLPTDTFTPRTYQVELLDSALKRNTMVCMGSTTGRSFIAVMLIKEMAEDVRKPLSKGGRRSIYLLDNESALSDFCQVIQHPSDLRVGLYTLHTSAQDWIKTFESYEVLVMTAVSLLSLLEQNLVTFSQVNLLILDECHLVLHDHPYRHIMSHYSSSSNRQATRILALTSNILKEKYSSPESLEQLISSLEEALCSVAETSTLVVPERYGVKPLEQVIECPDYEDTTGLIDKMSELLESAIDFLGECNIEVNEDLDNRDPTQIPEAALIECHNIMTQLGPWCAACLADMLIVQIEKIEKQKEFIPMHKKFLKLGATTLRMVSKLFDDHFKNADYTLDALLSYSSPKVRKLLDCFRKYHPETDFVIVSEEVDSVKTESDSDMSDDGDSDFSLSDDEENDGDKSPVGSKQIHVAIKKVTQENEKSFDPFQGDEEKFLSGIVFVEHQHEAYALNKFIEEVCAWEEQFCFIKSSHITGHTVRTLGRKETKLFKKQEDTLRKFRMQELNLLVSTSVLEEGVDVPKCNLVVRFDVPKDYRSYSQSKGRARARDAEYIILIEEENFDEFESQLKMYRNIEQVLIGHHREAEDEQTSQEEVNSYDDPLPPYIPSSVDGAPQVSMSTAIALVNRYCAKLPSDAFTHLTPSCCVNKITIDKGTRYIASLRLPINSPVKLQVQGEPMSTQLKAKQAVALKMCEILHKNGELDNNLMPVGKEMFQHEETEVEWEDEEDILGEARPGTTKRKQYYFKKVATPLQQSHPVADNCCNLYIFNMKLTGAITDEQNTRGRRIYAPEESPRGFGLLTSKIIPLVPLFPVYTRSGEVSVSIDLLTSNLVLTQTQLNRLHVFHRFVFASVLRLEKDPMDYVPKEAIVGYLIVPVITEGTEESQIDWSFIDKVELSLQEDKSENQEQSEDNVFIFKEEDYEDAVVMPSYRNIDQPQYFYVAEIRYDLSPLSAFPSPELYKTFCAYYTTKYGLSITNMEQPLLDVDHTSARLNLLIPRYMNQKGVALPTSSAETKKARRENLQQKQILVPELCDVHVFPSSLWRKAVCLPAILYRLNYLLLAEQIRKHIAAETDIGIVELPLDFRFPQLDFGFDTSPENLKSADDGDKPEKHSGEHLENADVGLCSNVFGKVDVENADTVDNLSTSASENISIETDSITKACSMCKQNANTLPQSMSLKSGASLIRTSNILSEITDTGHLHMKCSMVESNNVCVTTEISSSNVFADTTSAINQSSTSKATFSHTKAIVNDVGISTLNTAHLSSCQNCNISVVNTNIENKVNELETFTDKQPVYLEEELNAVNGYDKVAETTEIINERFTPEIVGREISSDIKDMNLEDSIQNQTEQNASGCSEIQHISNQDTNIGFRETKCFINAGPDTITETKLQKKSFNDRHDSVDDTMPLTDETGNCQCAKIDVESNIEKKDCQKNSVDVFKDVSYFQSADALDTGSEPEEFPEPLISLDEDIDLRTYIGPSPCSLLQAFTMSNANDFFSLERLETIGDSFLKYAITVYLYCSYPGIHEGKLSYLRSKQVSNYNLYRLGKKKGLAESMISTKFEPYENWLPPGFIINEDKRKGPVPKVLVAQKVNGKPTSASIEIDRKRLVNSDKMGSIAVSELQKFNAELEEAAQISQAEEMEQGERLESFNILTPYSLQLHHSIPDKSIADCVEALIGCYLTSCGKMAALKFMSWIGLKVLPNQKISCGEEFDVEFNQLPCSQSPLLSQSDKAKTVLEYQLSGYEKFEAMIGYKFRDRSYLLQAFTHASYHYNTVTDCYQRLEFLGDAILDYVITRHLYEDSDKYSPGVLTDLRSALVNNNIFAALAVKWNFHKYFKAISPVLFSVIEKFVARQKEKEDEIDLEDEEGDEDQDKVHVELEVPKALGDIFESVAGAIYLDSGMSLDTVWGVFYRIMKPQIDKYLKSIPKSPVRELLEQEPETAKFEKPERTMDGKIRVTVNVVGKGVFSGVGRNYRIAKSAAAKKALRCIRTLEQQGLI